MIETQELLGNILAASNQGVWAIELDEGSEPRMYADTTMRRLLGVEGISLTPEQVYHAWYDHIHTDHLDEVHRSVEEMIQGLQSEVQYPWQHPTEGEIWVRCSGVRNRTYSKGVRLEGLHRDVTELHHIQKRIDKLETQNRIGAERDVNLRRINAYLSLLLRESDMEAAISIVQRKACEDLGAAVGALCSFRPDGRANKVISCYVASNVPGRIFSCLEKDEPCTLLAPEAFATDDLIRIPDVAEALAQKPRMDILSGCRCELEGMASVYLRAVHYADRLWGCLVVAFRERRVLSPTDEEFLGACASCVRLMLFRKTNQDQMAELVEQAKAAERSKSLFLASISHDLRTPLNSILGFSELLREERDETRREDYLANISYSGGILLDLINDVLDLARMDAQKLKFVRAPMDVRREVELVLNMLRGKAEDKGLALVCKVPQLGRVELDEHRFRQVVFNLVGNAVKFTDRGSVVVSAKLERSTDDEGTLYLAVADTGIGISAGDLERLMQPFERGTTRVRDNTGTGLGLSICKRLVEHGGGHLEVSSELGKGSVFTAVLPGIRICEEEKQSAPVPSPDELPLVEEGNYGGLSVLIVDDIEINRIVLASLCRRLGVEDCVVVSSARMGLEQMRSRSFDLVFTDMKMPEMDGTAFIQEVRNDSLLSKARMILVTADVAAGEYYRKVGADGVLIKPITTRHLAEEFDKCLRVR